MTARPIAIVTGASAGIGEELARLIAADGYDLVLVARRADRLEALARTLDTKVHVIGLDLIEHDAGARLEAQLGERGIVPDVLVNNAGFGVAGPFVAHTHDRAVAMVDLNMRAVVDLSHRFLPGMLERRGGGILNVASLASFLPGPHLAVYYATKAFVLSFSEAVAEECRGTGVTISALCPGPTRSEFGAIANMENSRLFKFSRKMTAADVADIGWRGFKRGRRVVVPGFTNKIGALASQLTPHALLLPVSKYLQSEPG